MGRVRIDVVLVVVSLALVALVGLVGVIVLAYHRVPVEGAVISIASGAAGALGSMLARTTGGAAEGAAKAALLFLGVSLAGSQLGCAGSFEEARLVGLKTSPKAVVGQARPAELDAYCRDLDRGRIAAGAWAKGAAVLSGVSGTGAGVVASVDERGVPRAVVVGAGVVALAAAALGAHQLVTAEGLGAAWARDCQ